MRINRIRRLHMAFGLGVAVITLITVLLALFNSRGHSIALVLIGGIAGFSASVLFFLFRRWPGHQARTAAIARHAATSTASVWLDRVLQPRIPLPSLAGMALQPDTAGYLVRSVQIRSAEIVLELGSGISTLLLAYIMERRDSGMIYSFDGEEYFAERTRQLLKVHNLSHRAVVTCAPLAPLRLDGWVGRWFESRAFDIVPNDSVDLIFIDGPPTATGALARYPAIPVLGEGKLKKGCVIFMDDADRAEESSIFQRWDQEGFLNDPQYLPLGTGLFEGYFATTR